MKIRIPVTPDLMILFPEARLFASKLPRKKKKALKKRLGKELVEWIEQSLNNQNNQNG